MRIALLIIGTVVFGMAGLGCDWAEKAKDGKASMQGPKRPKSPSGLPTATTTSTTTPGSTGTGTSGGQGLSPTGRQ